MIMKTKCGLGLSRSVETSSAVEEAIAMAKQTLDGDAPAFAFFTSTVEHDAEEVVKAARRVLPGVALHGITTSLGVLGAHGVLMGSNGAIGVLLASASEASSSSFRVAHTRVDDDAREAGRVLGEKLLVANAGRRPDLVLFHASPGQEESLLEGLAAVLPNVPTFGGSAADHAIAGEWSVFTDEGALKSAASAVGVYGGHVGGSIVAPYVPTSAKAVIGKSEGRRILELDGRRASDVVHAWVGSSIDTQAKEGGNILAQTSRHPLGLRHASDEGEYFVTLHPAHIDASSGAVDLFAQAPEGSEVYKMEPSALGLLDSLERLIERALSNAYLKADDVGGGVLIYCAGCAGAVGDALDEALRRHLNAKLPGVPILGLCTFGEQGWVQGVGNVHANLAMSLALFE